MHYFLSSNILVRLFAKFACFFSFLYKKPIKTQLFRRISDILQRECHKTRKVRQTNFHTFLLECYHFGLLFAKN